MAVQESRLIISIDARNAERTARALNSELQGITNNGNRATSQTNALGASMQSLAGYMAGVVTVGAAISKMDAYTGLQNRLKLVTNSQTELNTAMNDTFAIAQKTASSWDSVAMVYQRFADNADRLGISMKQTAALTETVSKAISVSGGSAASAEAALMQFGQALASGVLRGEEFNSIAEQAPGLLKAIAFGLDTNVGSLRAMAAEGKITGDVLVEALSKAQPYIDDLFNKTDFTIAQSFTRLSNEITKFVGAAGAGSGAAAGLSAAISGLANNLSTIADIAIVGGVALLTKTILTQTVAIYGSVTASVARRSALLAELAAQVQLTGLEVQRTRQVAALALTEVHLARQELNSATTRQARAAATMRLTQAEIALALAQKQKTAATAADTVVQNANNAARSRGAAIFAAMGGPIGAITIGVAALAAGYMYLKSRTAEANAKLEEQGQIASKTSEELEKLAGNDKVSAVNDLTAAFNDQNKKLAESKEAVDAVLFAIRASSVENERARKITEDARNGVISYTDAIKLLNNEKISVDLYNKLKQQADQYDENSIKAGNTQRALSALGKVVELTGNAAQDAVNKHNSQADAIDAVGSAAARASKQLADYNSKIREGNLTNLYETAYMNQGYSPAQAKALVDAQRAVGLDSGILSEQQIKNALESVTIAERRNKLEDSYTQKQRESTKASKKAQSEADKARKKQENDNNRLIEQQAQLRDSIQDTYDTEFEQIERRENAALSDLAKAGFKPDEYKKYSEIIKNEYQAQRDEYLKNLSIELNEYTWTEDYKLDYAYKNDKAILENSNRTNGVIKERQLKYLDERYAYEKAQLELAKQARLLAANEVFMSEKDKIAERYRLEREEILRNKQLTEQERQTQIAGTFDREALDTATQQQGVAQNYLGAIGVDYSMEAEFQKKKEAIIAANEWEFITEQEKNTKLLELEKEFQRAKMDVGLSGAESIAGSMAGMFKTMMGEQSAAYRVMLAVEKAAAIARSTIAIQSALALAANNPFPMNLVHMATVAAQTASIVGNIKSVADGFYTGGYTGNIGTREVAGVVHGQEYVLNAEATKRVGRGTLDALNNGGTLGGGGISVNIQNYGTSKAFEIEQLDENTVRIIARDEARKTVADDFRNPNSLVSKAASQNLNAPRRRG